MDSYHHSQLDFTRSREEALAVTESSLLPSTCIAHTITIILPKVVYYCTTIEQYATRDAGVRVHFNP